MTNERIVITGATGNIGHRLLTNLDHKDIIGTSRKATKNQHIIQVKDFSVIPSGNILVHLAEEKNRKIANGLGKKYVNQATGQMDKILEKGFDRIIYASSALVYSDSEDYKRRTEEELTPYDYYSEAKLINEVKVLNHNGLVARIANIVSDTCPTGVILDIISGFKKNSSIVLNDISPTRDFICIDDVISCFISLIHTKARGIFNVGTGKGMTVFELASLIGRLMGLNSVQITSKKNNKTSQSTLVLDIKSTQESLNWSPQIDLKICLRKLLQSL